MGSGLRGYRLSRDGAFVRELPPNATAFMDKGLHEATGYSYSLTAVDTAGVESGPAVVLATTDACVAGAYYCSTQPSGVVIPCGSSYVQAYTPTQPAQVIGFRYTVHVDRNDEPAFSPVQDWKIIFAWMSLFNPTTGNNNSLVSLLSSNRISAISPPGACNLTTDPTVTMTVRAYEASTGIGVQNLYFDNRLGARSSDQISAPMTAGTVDLIKHCYGGANAGQLCQTNADCGTGDCNYLWSASAAPLLNLNQKAVSIAVVRGDTTTDLAGWTCPDTYTIPAGTYRIWNATITVDASSYQIGLLLPDDETQYLAPWDLFQLGTENFSLTPGFFRAYYFDAAFLREGSATWEAINQWQIFSDDKTTDYFGWGTKAGMLNGRTVLEVSNDGTNTYAPLGTILTIP